MLRQATRITLLMRHGANLVVCLVLLVVRPFHPTSAGVLLAGGLGSWALYRLASQSISTRLMAVDYLTTVAACLGTRLLAAGPHFYLSNSAPVAIAGTAVISFTISTPVRLSLAMAMGIAGAFAAGSAMMVGWSHIGDIFNLYYFALQWATAALIRLMVLRVADSVDRARTDRLTMELHQEVGAEVRRYDREQMRLLHDTVASTLLMAGAGTTLAQDRLMAQATRDLDVLGEKPWAPTAQADLVDAVRAHAVHITTPVDFLGDDVQWLNGTTVNAVAAAAREALNNVERHAHATTVTVSIEAGLVRITDDGCGFDAAQPGRGYGIARSIRGRMHELGGEAIVASSQGQGATVELRWPTEIQPTDIEPTDPEQLIARTRRRYGLALIAYAIANLVAMVVPSLATAGRPGLQLALATVAVAATLAAISAISAIVGRRGLPSRPAAAVLLAVSLAQSVVLPVDQLGTGAQWSQGVIGWCVLPLLLGERLPYGALVLAGVWSVPAIYALVRDLSVHTLANLGYGTASILGVQLCSLAFSNLIRQAARDASAETTDRMRLIAAERITAALQAEYQRRYADLANTIRPLLTAIARTGEVDAVTRRRSQLEYQRLRALFDQSSTFEHPLLRELRPRIDDAQDRGIAVSITIEGTLSVMSDGVAQRLVQPVCQALKVAGSSARVIVTGDRGGTEISVISHGVRSDALAHWASNDDDLIEVITDDDTVWLTVRHPTEGGTQHHVDADHAATPAEHCSC
jgi:hypothetical protein